MEHGKLLSPTEMNFNAHTKALGGNLNLAFNATNKLQGGAKIPKSWISFSLYEGDEPELLQEGLAPGQGIDVALTYGSHKMWVSLDYNVDGDGYKVYGDKVFAGVLNRSYASQAIEEFPGGLDINITEPTA